MPGSNVPSRGEPLNALDTPALVVDLAAVERNIAALMSRVRGRVSVRPHLKTAKSPDFARLLLAAGANGVCVAKLGEAEVLVEAGIEDVLITTELVGQRKLERLVLLLQRPGRIRLVVDSLVGARALNAALAAAGLRVEVLIDVDVGQHRSGVLPGAPALELARELRQLPQLELIGLQGYEGHLQLLGDAAEREQGCLAAMSLLAATARELASHGFRMDVVSTGGSGTAEICARQPGVTEVQPGSFLFWDTAYRRAVGVRFEHALSVLSTVISRPRAQEAVVDAGLKTLSTDSGFAEPKSLVDVQYRPAGDEHGILSWSPETRVDLQVGDRVELLPSHIDTTINLHDTYCVLRDGLLEHLWPVSARGRTQ